MDITLKQETLKQYSCVYKNAMNREETTESVVPDTMPDIARILDTDSVIYLRSKTIQSGKVMVDATVQSTVLYLAEDSDEIFKIELSKPVSFPFENEDITENDRCCIQLKLNQADTRILNPRKILLRVDTQAEIMAYSQKEISIPSDKESCDDLQILTKECEHRKVSMLNEKNFSVTEEFSFPSVRSGEIEILSAKCCAAVEETKQVGEKMILQGSVSLRLLYKSDETGSARTETYTSSFSQIMDCVGHSEGPHSIWITPTSMRLETVRNSHGNVIVLLELNLCAQMICREKTVLHYIRDAYSLSGGEELAFKEIEVNTDSESISLRETVRDVLETTESVQDILDAYAHPGIPVIGERGVRVPLNLRVIYRDSEGHIHSLINRITAELGYEASDDQNIYLYPVKCVDPYFAVAAGGIEVRIPVEIKMDVIRHELVTVIKAIEITEEQEQCKGEIPSLTVVRCCNTDLWTIAKKIQDNPGTNPICQ